MMFTEEKGLTFDKDTEYFVTVDGKTYSFVFTDDSLIISSYIELPDGTMEKSKEIILGLHLLEVSSLFDISFIE